MKKSIFFILATLAFFSYSCKPGKTGETSTVEDSVIIQQTIKPSINVYVENSGSMFGYISRGNEFDRSISTLLTALHNNDFEKHTYLYYINSKPFLQNTSTENFIKNLTVHNASTWAGVLSKTDISALLDTVTSTVTDTTISIFISDCIFSPGKALASKVIGAQKDAISRMIHDKLENADLAYIVYRMQSKFNGNYYDCDDKPTYLKDEERPFFIWIIGNYDNIKEYQTKKIIDKIDVKPLNVYTFSKNTEQVSYAVQTGINYNRLTSNSINKAKKNEDNGKFMFTIGIDYSSLLVGNDYLTNPSNYQINDPNYHIEKIITNSVGTNTHELQISTSLPVISPTTLVITLKNQIPDWVDEYSDDTCTSINAPGMMEKTFGFKDIFEGVFKGFNAQTADLATFTIQINK